MRIEDNYWAQTTTQKINNVHNSYNPTLHLRELRSVLGRALELQQKQSK